jgi:hypothetical protein
MISNNIKNLITILERKFEVDASVEGGSPNVDYKTKIKRIVDGAKQLTKHADEEIKPSEIGKAIVSDAANLATGYTHPISKISAIKNAYTSNSKSDFIKKTIKDTAMNAIPLSNVGKLAINSAQNIRKKQFNINRLAKVKTYLAQRSARLTSK